MGSSFEQLVEKRFIKLYSTPKNMLQMKMGDVFEIHGNPTKIKAHSAIVFDINYHLIRTDIAVNLFHKRWRLVFQGLPEGIAFKDEERINRIGRSESIQFAILADDTSSERYPQLIAFYDPR